MGFMQKKRRAVTLAEILVAVVTLAIAALPMFGLLSFSSRGTREQEAESEAVNLAKEEMNRLMYVISQENLLDNAGSDIPCTFAGATTEVMRKGNLFKGFYTVYPHTNAGVYLKVPKMKFHKPQECNTGAEMHDNVVDPEMITMSLQDLYPKNDKPLLVDIYLEITWRLPSQSAESVPQNKIVLAGRRYFNVE